MDEIAVQMLTYISGGRYDGTSWPPAGAILVLPYQEGRDLIRAQVAIEVPMPEKTAPAPAVSPEPVPEPQPEPAQEPPPAPVQPPAPADPKAAWIEHAIQQGMNPDEANATTKADLMSRFGGRL